MFIDISLIRSIRVQKEITIRGSEAVSLNLTLKE